MSIPRRRGSRLLVPALLLAACGSTPPPPPPPGLESLPSPDLPIDLRLPAARARGAVERVLGRTVPDDAAVPEIATRDEMEDCLVEELRPQVNFLYPDAPENARETVLRATARASSRSVMARYSPPRRRILVTMENLPSQARAAGLPGDRTTLRELATLVLAHEMVHAADDAVHDLGALFHAVPDAESLRALGMVAEGRAVHYARRAGVDLGLREEVLGVLPGGHGEPDERRARFLLTYREGAAFIAALEARGGAALAERALDRPPRSTSTVFHPERFEASGEIPPPDLLPSLRAAGFEGGEASELDLRARWLPLLGEEGVARAFAGFRAGVGMHRDGGGVSLSLHETPEAAAAYADALRRVQAPLLDALRASGRAVVEIVEARGTVVAASVAPDDETARRERDALLEGMRLTAPR